MLAVLHPQEVALLQNLVRAGRLTQDGARSFAQALESRRNAGERPSLVDALVANRIASADEIARALKQSAGPAPPGGRGNGAAAGPPPPYAPGPSAPPPDGPGSTERIESFIKPPRARDSGPTQGPRATRPAFPAPSSRPGGDAGPYLAPSSPGRSTGFVVTGGPGPPPSSPFGATFRSGPPSGPGSGEAETLHDPHVPAPGATGATAGGTGSIGSAGNAGSYELETKIGEGGLGDVWKAKHTKQRRTVAVKVFRPASLAPEELERLLGEARTASRVRHPNIISVHEVGKLPDGRSFVAMDFIDGSSLAQTLEGRTLGAAEVARIGAKIASALQAAHEQGIVHGDVKPQNILLDDRSEPFIGDFGLAHEDGEDKPSGIHYRGTPGYLAPEQVGASPAPGPRSDVYSLGATLYHCLTRKPPFTGATPLAAAKAAIKGRPQRPTRLEPTVPPELEAVIMKALDPSPERRYTNAAGLGEDLRRFLDGRPLEAKPLGAFAGGAGLLVAIAAALVVTVGGAAVVLVARKVTLEKHVHVLEDLEAKGEFQDLEAKARALVEERPDEARAQRYLAYGLLGEEKASDAFEAARRAVDLSGEAPEDLVAAGIAGLAADKHDDARSAFEKALAKKPLPPVVEGRASAGLACLQALADAKAAADAAHHALDLAPDDAETLALAGHALLVCRDGAAALEALRKATAARPKDQTALTDRALAVAATGDANGAVSDLDQAIAQRPDDVTALVARARLKLATGDDTAASEDADKAREIDASSKDAQLTAALALAWEARFDDAEARVQELARLAPLGMTTAIARAILQLCRGKPDDAYVTLRDVAPPAKHESGLLVNALRSLALRSALRHDEAAIEADTLAKSGAAPDASWLTPADDDALVDAVKRHYGFSSPESTGHALKAEALYFAGKTAEARLEVDAAKHATPTAPRTAYADGLVQIASNPPDFQGALRTADTAIQASPDLPELRALRAEVRLDTNALSIAQNDIDIAVKRDPTNFRYHLIKSQVRRRMGDAQACLSELDAAERYAPRTQVQVCAIRASVCISTGQFPEAKKAAEKGLSADPRNPDCLHFRGLARFYMHDERYDEDLLAAISTPQAGGRVDLYLERIKLFLMGNRAAQAERTATDLFDHLQPSDPTRLEVQFLRASARALIPERWKEAVDDLEAIIAQAGPVPDLLGLRGFVLAGLGNEAFADDAKKCLAAPNQQALQQSVQQILGRGVSAARIKLPGTWTRFYEALAEATDSKELKVAALRVVAEAYRFRGQIPEAIAEFKRVLEIAPSDEASRRLIEQLEKSAK